MRKDYREGKNRGCRLQSRTTMGHNSNNYHRPKFGLGDIRSNSRC